MHNVGDYQATNVRSSSGLLLIGIHLAAHSVAGSSTGVLPWHLVTSNLFGAQEFLDLAVAALRALYDHDAPADGPDPAQNVDGGQQLEDAKDQLSLVRCVLCPNARC